MLEAGLSGTAETLVVLENTAGRVGSGSVPVFATPMLVALVESAAIQAVAAQLPEGFTTVGTHIDLQHLAATPVGLKVKARAVLTEVAGKRLTFRVEAYDSRDKIGEGTHRRYLVNLATFMERVEAKAKTE
jgi:fluoroacetyl-CoA thioesterase